MDRRKGQQLKLLPDYALLPIMGMLLLNGITYIGTRYVTDDFRHYDLSGALDYRIPFWPVFIIPYAVAFIQWIVGYMAIARQGKEYCYRVMGGEMLSKLMVCLIYILFPTTMLRGEIIGSDIWSSAVALLYRIDPATNLFPSIHCLESYICMKAAWEMEHTGKGFRIGMSLMSILVILSTLFIKQHVVMDVFAAVIVAEAGRLLCDAILKGRKGKLLVT